MSIFLLGLLYIIGIMCLWIELIRKRTARFFVILFSVIFVLTVLSRVDNYHSYSDLGAYIWRFINGDNAYFGLGYQILTNAIRQVFGNNEIILLIVISSFNLITALLAVHIISYEKKDIKKRNSTNTGRYIGSFLLLYSMYWGLSFSSEVIRSGLAITLSLLVIALIIKRKTILAIIIYVISITFQWTQILLLPYLLIVRSEKSFKPVTRFSYIIWLIVILVADAINFSSLIGNTLTLTLSYFFKELSLYSHYSVYLVTGERASLLSYLSQQYLFYRITGLLLLFGDLRNKKYNIFTYGYFIGLSIFSLLNVFEPVTRTQWIYLVLIVFAIYFFIKENKKYSYAVKGLIVSIYLLLQTIMTVLYLG